LLTDREYETGEDPADQKRNTSILPGTERLFVRMTLWQTILSVVGIFIAVVALYAALKESAAVRQQTAAAVWPFVQMVIADYDNGDMAGFTMSFVNVGVGPAKVRNLRLEIDGQPIRDWAQAVSVLGGDVDAKVGRDFLGGRVLRPEEKVDLISTTDPDLARRFQLAIATQGNYVSYCYCSIFDECWLADSRADLQNPEPVEMCPDFGDESFEN
jgi:hypothetical protein